jgi:DNA invertase Pin-like site-specific DNA recombinase
MTVLGYLRVSTDEQARSGLGLDAQRESIRAEADRRGWTVEWIADDGVSGGTAPRERVGLSSALDRMTPGDVLVVAKLDRLGRSALDVIGLARQAEDEGWDVVILDLGLDTTTPVGRFTLTIIAGVAELERDLIRQRTRDALAALKARGVRLGRPHGIPDDVMVRVLAERGTGATLRTIADGLNADGIPTPAGSTWYAATVSRVLNSAALDNEAAARRVEVA